MKGSRTSKLQMQILICLGSGLKRGIFEAKSTIINHAVNVELTKKEKLKNPNCDGVFVHPNNFRKSCEKLSSRGLILRKKKGFDWFLCLTADGFDLLNKLNEP
ncbi:hypothetical protein ACWO80_003464 [Vibrio cholerae]